MAATKKEADKPVRLTHPNGTVVSVVESKAEALRAAGYTDAKAKSAGTSKS